MKSFLYFAFAISVFGHLGLASEPEILWVKFEKVFTYKDIDRFCTTKGSPPSILFGAELIDGVAQAATFKTDTVEVLAERLPFTADELKGVNVGKDKTAKNWIESIQLNARQLNWIFTRAGGMDSCLPTQPLATLNPNDFRYAYNLSEISVEPQVASNLGKFSGKRKDGRLYQISLELNQRTVNH